MQDTTLGKFVNQMDSELSSLQRAPLYVFDASVLHQSEMLKQDVSCTEGLAGRMSAISASGGAAATTRKQDTRGIRTVYSGAGRRWGPSSFTRRCLECAHIRG